MSVAVRRAVLDDCAALFGLISEHALFERSVATLTLTDLKAILQCDAPPVTILVGAKDGDLLGFAALTFDFALWRARWWAHLRLPVHPRGKSRAGAWDNSPERGG